MIATPSRERTGQRGFALPEVLVAVFILGMLTLAIVGLATLGTRTAFESERQTVALGLANQHIERIRVLSYDSIGFTTPAAGEPDGVLFKDETRSQNNQPYTVTTAITLVDDPLNGSQQPLTEASADYKKVEIKVRWRQPNGSDRDLTVVTYVARGAQPLLPTPSLSPSPAVTPTASPAAFPTMSPGPSPSPSVAPAPCTCPDGSSCPTSGVCCSNCLSTGCPAPVSGFTTDGYCYYTSWSCSITSSCSTTGTGCEATTTYYPCYSPTPSPTPSL